MRLSYTALAIAPVLMLFNISLAGQGTMSSMPNMAGMPGMPAMPGTKMTADPFASHDASGTSFQPESTPSPMLMTTRDGWTLMAHALGFVALQEQSGARGADKLFSPNWAMAMAQRRLGPGKLTLRAMLSLEPLTITDRRYPELLQTGETAFGLPIVDGQHPHNFFMELAALYDLKLGEHTMISLYAAPMGDPAIGPTAFPHRESASEDPIAPLGHHLEDSTHVAADVLTAGASYRGVRLEASLFHGREPNENRWNLQTGGIDSWSSRVNFAPGGNWAAQYSLAHIKSPEALFPAGNQFRQTASIMYNRPLANGDWANTLLWGRTRDVGGHNILNGYLLESTLGFAGRNHAWTRIENADKTNQLQLGEAPLPLAFAEHFLGRVQAYSFGYDRDLPAPNWLAPALGVQWTWYATPAPLRSSYGSHPQGVVVFLRFRLGATRH